MKEEKIVLGMGTEFPLNGKLTLPESEKPVPAVVFVHGSGSSNMDEKVMKVTPFKDLAEGLAKHGIASIRYDKRSFAHGRKMLKKGSLTVREEVIEDAVRASEMLKNDPRIDPEKVFIIGHSMGAMLAPRIDAEGGNFKGLVLMAGTLDTLEGVLFRQLDEMKKGKSKIMSWVAAAQEKKFKKSFEDLYEISDDEAKKRKEKIACRCEKYYQQALILLIKYITQFSLVALGLSYFPHLFRRIFYDKKNLFYSFIHSAFSFKFDISCPDRHCAYEFI